MGKNFSAYPVSGSHMIHRDRNFNKTEGEYTLKQNAAPDPQELDALIRTVAAQVGADPESIRSSVQGGSPDDLLKQLGSKDAAMLQQALSNRETTARILASPQAQEIIRKLMERK